MMNKTYVGLAIIFLSIAACKPSDHPLGGTGGGGGAGGNATSSVSTSGGGAPASGSSSTSGSNSGSSGSGSSTGTGGIVKPATFPRLVVSSDTGVAIWDNADLLVADAPPSATLGGVSAGIGLALHGDLLYVASSDAANGVYRFANAEKLADGAMPASSISSTAFGGAFPPFGPTKMQFDSAGDLWLNTSNKGGSIELIKSADTAVAGTANFASQIVGMIYDEQGGKLLGGVSQGGGTSVWNNAATKSGNISSKDWSLPFTAWHMAIVGDRLYTSAYGPADVQIWNAISATTATKAPDFTLKGLCGAGPTNEIRSLMVTNDTLVVIHNEIIGGVQVEKVCLFKNVSAMTSTHAPDAVAAHMSLKPGTDKALLTADGHLFVMDTEGVAMFKNATTAPEFVIKIKTGITKPHDILVME